MTFLAEENGWRYAAWVAVDLRLLLFVVLFAALASVGVSAMLVRSGRFRDMVAVFIIGFTLILAAALLIFNEVAHHPVLLVEAAFPFP